MFLNIIHNGEGDIFSYTSKIYLFATYEKNSRGQYHEVLCLNNQEDW